MQRALTAEQTRRLEERAMASLGVDVAELMRRVGVRAADVAADLAGPEGRIVVVCGPGNNAGDGWVAAQTLADSGRDVAILSLFDPEGLPQPAQDAAASAIRSGIRWSRPETAEDLTGGLARASVVVDALFGFGVHGPLREPYASAVEAINDAEALVFSVDLPSGVEGDTGHVGGTAVAADHTLAVLTLKVGHVQEPGRSLSGTIEIGRFDVEPGELEEPDAIEVWHPEDVRDRLPAPSPTDHKGSTGRVLVVGGSEGMTGAPALAAWGALRTGAGFVTVGLPTSLVDVVDEAVMPAVVLGLPEREDRTLSLEALEMVLEAAERADAVILGPGLSRSPDAAELALQLVRRLSVPLVLDADALHALAASGRDLSGRDAPTVITPHPGEAARLLDTDSATVQTDRPSAARTLARLGAVVALKGPGTVIAGGDRVAVVGPGSAALATMGTGDVLAGVVGALLAGGSDAFEATYVAAYLHGVAGELAAEELTQAGVTALDVAHTLPAALRGV